MEMAANAKERTVAAAASIGGWRCRGRRRENRIDDGVEMASNGKEGTVAAAAWMVMSRTMARELDRLDRVEMAATVNC